MTDSQEIHVLQKDFVQAVGSPTGGYVEAEVVIDGTSKEVRIWVPSGGGGSVPDATTTVKGKVELAENNESAASVVVQGNDDRLSDARTPTSHTHNGTDILDESLEPDVVNDAEEWRTHLEVAEAIHAHTATQITSGTLNDARLSSFLQALAALGTTAGRLLKTTGVDTASEITISSFGESLIDDADAAAARSTLGASAIVMVQCIGTSTAVIENTTADVTWNGTAVVADSAVSFSSADITFNTAGTYQVSVSVRSTGTQRMQTIVQGYLDTGSGYVSQTDWLSDNYNSRDSDQNDGVTHLNVALVASAGDKIKFDAHANADSSNSSAVLATTGTNVMILGKT